ncbi:50S ribosomal protein L21 [Buchnera aphidicola (Nipponaphis monzeni)]|uniref:Large ribosomal subunit protein bL21 n=1 Tax=Buchnera aphidicola (Nipponaphis monzeni) TaxID=2495405 RepID=A0A455TAG6_9GAMM|nr:50S ribosomal protein L21 [Buchnera aphidicola]BBI01305.1 50S ribosomal protein L21 [Buchnera aphidicola (Nipponaphis monzeni)]
MYAVFVIGGKQYKAYKGDTIRLEKLDIAIGETFLISKILMISKKSNTTFGYPFLNTGKVQAKILIHGRNKKINIIKFNRRKHYKKQQGHRQHFTDITIVNITNDIKVD